jgi:hypothetical protein
MTPLPVKMPIAAGDPSVAVDGGGRVYFGSFSNGHAMVTTSADKAAHWTAPVDVGASFGIQNTEFPVMLAGDAGRAAFAFLGTPTAGDDQSTSFAGVWHLYVGFTYDGGATWTTQDVTPGDPVQVGCVGFSQTSPCRNMADFMTGTLDGAGYVLVGYSDGYTPTKARDSLGTIAHQVSGTPLYAS